MNRSLRPFVVGLLAALLLLPGCGKKKEAVGPSSKIEGGSEVVATYGDQKLTLDEFGAEVEKLPPQIKPLLSAPDRRKQFLENYILSQLLVQEGEKKGLDKDEDIQKQLDEMKKRLILQKVFQDVQQQATVGDADVKSYYDGHPDEFSNTQIHAAHILVEDEAAANKILDQVKKKPDSFAELAKKLSKDTATAPGGGDLGSFERGRMVPEFEKAAFSLKQPGEISGVVHSPFGFHIIKLIERKDGKPRPFDQVREEIRSKLLQDVQRKKMEAYFENLKKTAKVEIDEKVLAKYNPGPALGGGLPGSLGLPPGRSSGGAAPSRGGRLMPGRPPGQAPGQAPLEEKRD
jgi:peptidyl-prolyl cis-trans isomerase C